MITFWFTEDLAGVVLKGERSGVAFGAPTGGFLFGLGVVAVYRIFEKTETVLAKQPFTARVQGEVFAGE